VSSPAIGYVLQVLSYDQMPAACCVLNMYGSGRFVVDAGDRRRGVGNRSMRHLVITLTLHTRPALGRLLLKDITHLCT
jgi:hypothetical protein